MKKGLIEIAHETKEILNRGYPSNPPVKRLLEGYLNMLREEKLIFDELPVDNKVYQTMENPILSEIPDIINRLENRIAAIIKNNSSLG